MPRIDAIALSCALGDLDATFSALRAGRASAAGPLPRPLRETLRDLARTVLAGSTADLLLLATTKAESDRWCAALVRDEPGYAGGPGRLAQELGAQLGMPAFAVSAACASAPIACGIAGRALNHGRVERILVLAGDQIGAFVRDGFTALKALDARGAKPFDRDRAGLALGETAGAVLLSRATGPGLHLQGWGASLDANHLTGPSRDGSGLERAVRQARARAGEPTLGLIIGHGTGTRYNDDSESQAYARTSTAPVVGYKGLLGHSLGACGLSELALATCIMGSGIVPGTTGLEVQGCVGAITVLPPGDHALRSGPILCANAGFGGINGALILGHQPALVAAPRAGRVVARCRLDAQGWTAQGGAADLSPSAGAWLERGEDGQPRLPAREVIGRIDPHWGRMDLACRALVAVASRLGELPTGCAIVLVTEAGCAASDRRFERERLLHGADPQRFAYTLPTTPIGEASIRLRLQGQGFALLGASDAQARACGGDLLREGAPAVLVARVEADGRLTAWAELWRPEDP